MAKNLVFPCRFIPRQMVLKGVLEKVESLVSLSSKPESIKLSIIKFQTHVKIYTFFLF